MKKIALIIAVFVTALSSTAAASASTDPRVPALKRQVAALTQRVTKLERGLSFVADTETCDVTYQNVINIDVLNVFNAMFGSPPYSGPTPNDNGACSRIGRTPPQTRTLSGYSPLGAFRTTLDRQLTW